MHSLVVSVPTVWTNLPDYVRNLLLSINILQNGVKTLLLFVLHCIRTASTSVLYAVYKLIIRSNWVSRLYLLICVCNEYCNMSLCGCVRACVQYVGSLCGASDGLWQSHYCQCWCFVTWQAATVWACCTTGKIWWWWWWWWDDVDVDDDDGQLLLQLLLQLWLQ